MISFMGILINNLIVMIIFYFLPEFVLYTSKIFKNTSLTSTFYTEEFCLYGFNYMCMILILYVYITFILSTYTCVKKYISKFITYYSRFTVCIHVCVQSCTSSKSF